MTWQRTKRGCLRLIDHNTYQYQSHSLWDGFQMSPTDRRSASPKTFLGQTLVEKSERKKPRTAIVFSLGCQDACLKHHIISVQFPINTFVDGNSQNLLAEIYRVHVDLSPLTCTRGCRFLLSPNLLCLERALVSLQDRIRRPLAVVNVKVVVVRPGQYRPANKGPSVSG
jgi:hypothetical protein